MSYKVSPFETPPLLVRPPSGARPSTAATGSPTVFRRRGPSLILGDTIHSNAASAAAASARIRLGCGTRGIAERGDVFKSRDEQEEEGYNAWLAEKREAAKARAQQRKLEDSQQKQVLLSIGGGGNNSHGAVRSASAVARASERRALERAAWRQMQWDREMRRERVVDEARREKAQIERQLHANEQARRDVRALFVDERVLEDRETRRTVASTLCKEEAEAKALATGRLYAVDAAAEAAAAAADEGAMGQHAAEVVRRMNTAREERARALRPAAAEAAAKVREERHAAEEAVRARKASAVLQHRAQHDAVVVSELASQRAVLVEKTARIHLVQTEAMSDAQQRRAISEQVRATHRERLDALAMQRKEGEAKRIESFVRRNEYVQGCHDEAASARREAERAKSAREGAREELRRSIAALRGEEVDSPRRARQMCLDERRMMCKYLREELELRKAEFERDCARDLEERRAATAKRRSESAASSRPGTAATAGGSSVRARSARGASAAANGAGDALEQQGSGAPWWASGAF